MKNNPPRLHKNLVDAVIHALESIFGENLYADRVLEKLLKSNKKWGGRDRAFIAETTYEMVRWWRYLWELYGKQPNTKKRDLYHLFGIWWMTKGHSLPTDWRSFEAIEDFDVKHAKNLLPKETGTLQSFPIWLDELMREELGENWDAIAEELNRPAHLIVRTNTLKTNRDALKKRLAEEKIATRHFSRNDIGLVFEERTNIFIKDIFKEGLFEVQDGGSQLIAAYLDPKPGMRVIDACAGAGGKSLHLASLMENKGSVVAMDVIAWKLDELKKRARRNGVHNIELRHIESSKTIKRLHNRADRLLLDVPCSGTGVIKRNPDTKWKLQPEELERVMGVQHQIIRDYSKMLKKDGLMVYATCSILPAENEDQVDLFLAENGDFQLVKEDRVNPSKDTDGFYMALIKRVS